VAELEERLLAIGPVNLVADDEYRELDERLTFLRTQYDDLTGSIKDLEKALRGMTRSAQERFLQAFEEINNHFKGIFERLFEGGRAELRLVEAEEGGDPLDTGVELMAQPRGKRLQSVTLMSAAKERSPDWPCSSRSSISGRAPSASSMRSTRLSTTPTSIVFSVFSGN
jgi:chromosome segregation protein